MTLAVMRATSVIPANRYRQDGLPKRFTHRCLSQLCSGSSLRLMVQLNLEFAGAAWFAGFGCFVVFTTAAAFAKPDLS
jgi:hypothetical protein